MQKLSLLPLLLVTGIGAVWASTLMFPNTNEFPRSPGGAGTISGALALFGADGTATNTDKLNGLSASGYLQNKDCSGEPINKVWVGVDATGKAICGTRNTLLAIGTISEKGGTFIVWRGGSMIASPIGTTVYEGDTIITDSTGTGTIAFIADESILRLDTSTTVELSVGQLSGQSVAQAILSDGRLWGRILTSTGVNLGGGGLVAGVRGTSVSIERPGTTGPYVISVIDSVNNGTTADTAAATLSSIGVTPPATGTPRILSAGYQVSVSSSPYTGNIPTPQLIGKTALLTTSPWIRDNTRADIDYLYHNRSVTRVLQEYDVTMPSSVTNEVLDALCPTLAGQNLIYWTSLIGTSLEKCKDSRLVAFADYTRPGVSGAGIISPAPLYTSGSTIGVTSGGGTWSTAGYSIIDAGDKIQYPITGLSLANKTITIELVNEPNPSNPTGTILDLGTVCNISWKKSIRSWASTCLDTTSTSTKLIANIPTGISQFYIGNQLNGTLPIGATIRSISIK